jgi:protein TonB
MSASSQMDQARLSTRTKTEPAEPSVELPIAAIPGASDQADFDDTVSLPEHPQVAESDAGVDPQLPSPESDAEPASKQATLLNAETAATRPDEASPDPAPDNDMSGDTSVSGRDAEEAASPQVAIAEPPQPTNPVASNTSNAASVEQPTSEAVTPPATPPAAEAKIAEPEAATPPATPQVAEAKIAEPSQPTSSAASTTSKAASVEQPTPQAAAAPAAPQVAEAKIAEPSEPTNLVASSPSKAASVEQPTPQAAAAPAAPEAAEAKIAEPSQPTNLVASSPRKAASVAQPTPKAATPPATPKVAEAKIIKPSQPKSLIASGTSKAASVEPASVQGAIALGTPKAGQDKPRPKQAARPNAPQENVSQPSGTTPWTPMALAPSDQPSTSLTKAPTNQPNASNYRATVWSALARHKPKAGERGSTTVIFVINENGALRFVRVGQSSGNQRLDQLALATVRNAAPYPAPPGGATPYTIRIDFH